MTADVAGARGWLDRHPLPADAAVALLVLAVSLQPLVEATRCGCGAPPTWGYGLVVLQCLPLVWRRRWPFWAGLATGLMTAAHGLSSVPEPPVAFAGLVALYTVAAHSSRRTALVAAALAAVVLTATLLLAATDADAQDVTVNYLVFATAWLLGDGARARRDRAAELEARFRQAERLRAVEADRALAEERTRIAREMHDVVAHAVSLMVVQAEAGPVVVHRDPERAVGVFDSISATGRSALVEMRRLLGVLRTEPSSLAPQPGLAALPELVARCRDAGLPVERHTEGEQRPLPPGADLAAYRVVQEALTNVLKHAGPARAAVTVRYDDDAVVLQVRDDGAGGRAGSAGGTGLIGMRERAALLGGSLTAGPAEGGGWLVRARLPAAVPVAP